MNKKVTADRLHEALNLLEAKLRLDGAQSLQLVVCGGSALICLGLVSRTTADVDVLAMMAEGGRLSDPEPLPAELVRAAHAVAPALGLGADWLNNGPSRGEGGLFRMGLPSGLVGRLHQRVYGPALSVWFIDRYDQIHLKLYAAVDRGGYHISDLTALAPSAAELLSAARWSMTHDPSEGFRGCLCALLEQLGHADIARQL